MTENNDQLQADDCWRTVKLHIDVLTRCVNSLDERLSRKLRDSNDVARKQDEDGRNDNVQMDCRVENIEKKLGDLQQILDAVAELTCSRSNGGNPAYSRTGDYLRTLKTSVMKNVKDVLNAKCASLLTGTAGAKRGFADAKRDDVERDAAKRRKTRHDSEKETRTVAATAIATTETSDVKRKSQYAVVVVNELKPYYKRGVFATEYLFEFMARTIVHRLINSTRSPDEHTVKSTIRQVMSEKRRISSKYDILTLVDPFY